MDAKSKSGGTIEAEIIRADGTREYLGVIASSETGTVSIEKENKDDGKD